MKTTLRQIGNSRGIIIPAALLAECRIEDEIDLSLEDGRLVITPIKPVRAGWFDAVGEEEDAWAGLVATAGEEEDWAW